MIKFTEKQLDENTWQYELPFSEIFVKAHTIDEEVEPLDAMSILKANFNDYCRATITESFNTNTTPLVTLSKLVAECPGCNAHAGNVDKVIRADKFLFELLAQDDMFAEEEDEDFNDRFHLGAQAIASSMSLDYREKLYDAHNCLAAPVDCVNTNEIDFPENIYGLSLSEVCKHDPAQLRIPVEDEHVVSRTFGIGSYFIGAYECPDCGTIFGVFYYDPSTELAPHLPTKGSKALELLFEKHGSRANLATPSKVVIQKNPEAVTVVASDEDNTTEIVFNTTNGLTKFDGFYYIGQEFEERAAFNSMYFGTDIFYAPQIANRVASLLGSNSEFTKILFKECSVFGMLRLLMGINRFKGYPESFYKEIFDCCCFDLLYPLASGLPRNYSDFPKFYEMISLPKSKAFKSMMLERPLVAFLFATFPDFPFSNTDVLQSLLSSERSPRLIKTICKYPNRVKVISAIAKIKGEVALSKHMLSLSNSDCGTFCHSLEAVSADILLDASERVAHCKLSDLSYLIAELAWETDNSELSGAYEYEYSNHQESYEGEFNGFSFKLPRTPKEIFKASYQLKNCLGSYASVASWSKTFLLFVYKGDKIVAAIDCKFNNYTHENDGAIISDHFAEKEITRANKDALKPRIGVSQARSACNNPLITVPGLLDAFESWKSANNVKVP